jgi:fibronectin-binding autotransporter adhesin
MHTNRTVAAVLAILAGQAAAQPAAWTNPAGGAWNTPANWSTGAVPNGLSFDVTLGLSDPYTVLCSISPSLATLAITNPLAVLDLEGGDTLTIAGGLLHTDGLLRINSNASIFNAALSFTANTAVTGSGTILLGAPAGNPDIQDAQILAGAGSLVTLGQDLLLSGNGALAGAGSFLAEGTIRPSGPATPGIQLRTALTLGPDAEIDLTDARFDLGANAVLSGGRVVGTNALRADASLTRISDLTLDAPFEVIGGGFVAAINGPVTNNNTLTLNPNDQIFNAILRFDVETTLGGTGTVVMRTAGDTSDAQITTAAGITGTIGAGQAISGSGQILGQISLIGSATADNPNTNLELRGTLSGSGQIGAENDAWLSFINADVSGLTIETDTGGVVGPAIGTTTASSIVNNGDAVIAGGGTTLSLVGDLTNNGTLTLNFDNRIFNAILRFDTNAPITGSGQIRMLTSGDTNDAQIVAAPGTVGTIGAGQSVSGSGLISGDIVLLGSVSADFPATNLSVTGSLTGSGSLRAENAAWLSFTNAAISGLTIETDTGGVVGAAVGTTNASDLTNNGHAVIAGGGTILALTGNTTNNGTITVNFDDRIFNAILRLEDAAGITGDGQIILKTAGTLDDAQITVPEPLSSQLGAGQTLEGTGEVRGNLSVLGSIRPSDDLRRINAFSGTLSMAPTTTSTFQIGGTQAGQFGRLTANTAASIHLDGACVVRFDDGYTPLRGDSWDIVSAQSRTGEFATFDFPPAPFGLTYRVFYQPGRVFVRLTCSSDFDGDNVLNFFDVSTYLALFNAQDPRADLSAPFGQFNFFDIAAFINNFNAGCP